MWDEPYEKDGEIKKLKVSTPGWKYRDVIISTHNRSGSLGRISRR